MKKTTEAGCIYTIGYGGKKPEQVRDLMTEHDIAVMVDTRRKPFSRNPSWSLKSLQAFFPNQYISLTGLGNHGQTAKWEPANWESANTDLEIVAEQLLGDGKSVLLLCLEPDPKDCHRSDVAEHLAKMTGSQVIHL